MDLTNSTVSGQGWHRAGGSASSRAHQGTAQPNPHSGVGWGPSTQRPAGGLGDRRPTSGAEAVGRARVHAPPGAPCHPLCSCFGAGDGTWLTHGGQRCPRRPPWSSCADCCAPTLWHTAVPPSAARTTALRPPCLELPAAPIKTNPRGHSRPASLQATTQPSTVSGLESKMRRSLWHWDSPQDTPGM